MKIKSLTLCFPLVYFLLTVISCSSPGLGPDTSEFIIAPGHTIELVASEPHVILPVAMIEDAENRLWAVEMPGYMRDIDGKGEDIPDGRIVILTDTNGDGKIDTRKIFLDSLLNPRAICFAYNGLLFTDGTQLKWTKTNNDIPGNSVVVDSFYVIGGNIEHQPNGLLYNIDNWIYSAKSNARYKLSNGKWLKEATTFRGQWGISMDEDGRLLYNHNSTPLLGDICLPNQILGNPYLDLNHSTGQVLTDDMRIFPIQATSVNRGYQPEVLDSTGKVINYTSACAPHLFYGSLATNYYESAFVCAPEANLIANYLFDSDSLSAHRQTGDEEFLISTDESFRPVNLHTGLDGNLYVVDMRKGIIQHSAYMSSYLRENITLKGLDKINGKGRIYRIKKEGDKQIHTSFSNLSTKELMKLFDSSNLQIRMFAQKELIAHNDKSNIEPLFQLALTSKNPKSKIHALWTIEGMGALNENMITDIGNKSNSPDVLYHLLILSKSIRYHKAFKDLYIKAFQVNSKKHDFILASIVGNNNGLDDLWIKISDRYPGDKQIAESLVSSICNREKYFLSKIRNSEKGVLKEILHQTIGNINADDNQLPQLIQEPFDDDRTNGLKIYKTYCASCHGMDGKGQKNVAPSLKGSKIISGDETVMASIILNGYNTGKSNYKILMPAYRDDKNMSDQDIYDIISYLKSTFTTGWNTIDVEKIAKIRSESSSIRAIQ